MKRLKLLFAAAVILLCLSVGALAGHVKPGGGWYCDDVDCVTCFDASCPDVNSIGMGKQTAPDVTGGVLLFALAFFIVYRLRS